MVTLHVILVSVPSEKHYPVPSKHSFLQTLLSIPNYSGEVVEGVREGRSHPHPPPALQGQTFTLKGSNLDLKTLTTFHQFSKGWHGIKPVYAGAIINRHLWLWETSQTSGQEGLNGSVDHQEPKPSYFRTRHIMVMFGFRERDEGFVD